MTDIKEDVNATSSKPPGVLRLRPPRHRVERKAILWWILQTLAFQGVITGGSLAAYLIWDGARSWLVVPLVGFAVLTLIGILVEPFWRYRVHRWELTDQATYALNGWVVREWRVAPISRIQTVDAVRGPFEQMLGLSTLRVTTASSKGAINIGGLDKDVAAEMAERLTVITQETPGDAT